MKVVILAGGFGSRLGSVTDLIPKPMVEIGGKPILWHVMKIYAAHGFREFIICLGYKGNIIKDYFYHYRNYTQDCTIHLGTGDIRYHNRHPEDWQVTLVDTGINTLKGGRIKRIEKYLEGDTHLLTYGDGVADIDLKKLTAFHRSHGKIVTVTGVRPPSLFGEIIEQDNRVVSFEEKAQTSQGLISGGFMVFHRRMMDYLTADESCDFEFGPLEKMTADGEVMTYKHPGSWQCADTVRDVNHLNKLWKEDRAFWKVW